MIEIISYGLAIMALFGVTILMLAKKSEYDQLAEYAARTEPIIVFSFFPGDTTVKKRANDHRRLLKLAGNKYGKHQGPVPVYEYPFLNIQKSGLDHHISMNHYLVCLGKMADQIMSTWRAQILDVNQESYERDLLRQEV